MKRFTPTLLLANLLLASAAWSAPAGVLLFAQEGTQIIDAAGTPRPAKRGDTLQPGERLRTPVGGILQLRLPDGSLVGMRPGAELALGGAVAQTGAEAPNPFVALTQGSVRVIGAELMGSGKTSALVFKSGLALLKLRGADLETAVFQPGSTRADQADAPGSYSRLLVGNGSIGNGALETPLAPRQINFVGVPNVAPTVIASISPSIFTPVAPITATTLSPTTPTQPALSNLPALSGDKLALSPITSTLRTVPSTTPVAPSPTLVTPSPVTTALLTPVTTTVAPAPVTPTPVVAPILAPVIVTPIITAPIVVNQPLTPTRLPVLSCKVLKTC